MLTNLQRNLRHLCNGYGTAAEVCSAMDINRLQFNQYLNGKRSPSAGTKRKICDYYRVTSAELDMPPRQFIAVMRHRPEGGQPVRPLPPANGPREDPAEARALFD